MKYTLYQDEDKNEYIVIIDGFEDIIGIGNSSQEAIDEAIDNLNLYLFYNKRESSNQFLEEK